MEYNRRQGNVGWLETHIWHAKRFHMTRVWGHALPSTPTDKCWRQTFRALTRGSIMWDVSFHKLIQLSGPKQSLLTKLNTLTSDNTGQVFSFSPGESSATLFRSDGVVGTVSYIWRPSTLNGSDTLWLWCHPGYYQEVLEMLQSLFSLEPTIESEEDNNVIGCKCVPVNNKVNEAKLELKCLPPTVLKGGDVTVTLLENKLNKIRMLGPQSLNVLKHCLHPVSDPGPSTSLSKYALDHSDVVGQCHSTFMEMETAKPGTVLSLIIMDPRVVLPAMRGKVQGVTQKKDQSGLDPGWCLQHGAMWSGVVRNCVSHHRVSDHDVNVARQSGTLNTVASSSVPIMLVATGQGWDIVLPSGWTMSLWMCLVYAGVKVGGLKEMAQCQLESSAGDLASLEDSAWAKRESLAKTTEMKESYFRLPPDKRPNYNILGTMSPFSRAWSALTGTGQWFVLRDKDLLNQLAQGNATNDYEFCDYALVPVTLKIEGKGKLSENTGIYLPLECDIKSDDFSLEEIKHKDENEQERKDNTIAHRSKLKQLKRQNKKIRSKKNQLLLSCAAQDIEVDENKKAEIDISLRALKGLREEEKIMYQQQNQSLWGSKNLDGLSSHNCRSLVGWVVAGGYSLKEGGEVGVGLITLTSLNSLLKTKYKRVLTRQPDNYCYRFAHYTIA